MSETKSTSAIDALLGSDPDHQVTLEHRAWMNDQIKQSLTKKERGETDYTPLEQARRKIGLDAA